MSEGGSSFQIGFAPQFKLQFRLCILCCHVLGGCAAEASPEFPFTPKIQPLVVGVRYSNQKRRRRTR